MPPHTASASGATPDPIPEEEARAYRALLAEAEKGDGQAQFELGYCFNQGKGVARDLKEAARWYRKAAKKGIAQAQYNLACCLKKGDGGRQDADEAAVWYRKAAEQGDADAQYSLGALLLEGAEGVPKDLKAGASFLGAAARQGDAEALAKLTRYAGEREVAQACCLGCGATDVLKSCSRCLVASFCGKACIARTWPVHKPHCKRWQAEATALLSVACAGAGTDKTSAE